MGGSPNETTEWSAVTVGIEETIGGEARVALKIAARLPSSIECMARIKRSLGYWSVEKVIDCNRVWLQIKYVELKAFVECVTNSPA